MKNMKISYKPLKEYVVYNLIKHDSPDNLARRTAIESHSMSSPSVKWIDGIVYKLTYPAQEFLSDNFAEQFFEGVLWIEVEFAEMTNFTTTINSQQENIVVPVVDNSNDNNEKALINWLKTRGDTDS